MSDATVVRIAACQIGVDLNLPMTDRVAHVTQIVRAQTGADLVVLPELWPSGGFLFERFAAEAQPLDGPLLAELAAAARTTQAWVHGGSFVERADDGRLFNTSVLLDPSGALRATYRKIHLFGFSGGETTVLSAGEEVATCDTPFGTVGLTTCYDLRFPELYRRLVDRGVTLCLVPAAWPQRRIGHWELLVRARAVESQFVVVAVNTIGVQGSARLGGRSMVVDAWGELLVSGGADEEQVLRVDVDLADVARVRAEFPVLDDRKL
jgi:predicted amidohydrolase